MKISVVTPSFNQAQFLPYNLASVRAQQGVIVEHIVVDPGSTDGSTEIARGAPGVTLIAEADRGQSDGICKGFSRATGDILVWLNSDDFYPDGHVLNSVLQCFKENRDVDIVYGDVNFVGESGEFLRKGFVNKNADQLLASFEYQVGIVQPGVFWRRRVFEEIGGPSDQFEYCMDYELWVRMATKGYKWKHLPKVLAHHRWWAGMKTSSRRDLSLREHFKVCDRYFGYVHWKWLDRYAEYLCSNQDGVVNHAIAIGVDEKAGAIRRAIDEVVTQEMLRRVSLATEGEQTTTREYINNHYPEKKRIYFNQSELEVISENSDDPKAQQRVAWNIFDVLTAKKSRFSAYHVPDNFDRYFDREWHRIQLDRARRALAQLNLERRGDICVIVGNGPSLRRSDLCLLATVDTIISNFAVLSPELVRHGRILTVVNDLVAKQGALDFNASRLIKFVPFWLANYFNEGDHTFFVNATVRPEFSKDVVGAASWRSTVSYFNMQLAYAIGYRKVLLIGFDHSYVQAEGVVEGVVINQVEDDENHFDPRYFKGKNWQAADTANMEKMYVLAKAGYENDGREIVNCTVGGKLDVFRRGDLATELGLETRVVSDSRLAIKENSFPRLLMIDSTPVGHASATGQLKQTFLGNWPRGAFLQIWESGGKNSKLHTIEIGQSIENSRAVPIAQNALIEKCKAYQPDVIYFRPVDSAMIFGIAEALVTAISKPLVIHMMDDWPERLRFTDIKKYARLESALRRLIGRACAHLSISEAMGKAYRVRYGADWMPLANGVDVADFPAKEWSKRNPVSPASPFVIRYMGGLADDMTYASVTEIARAVSSLQADYPVRLEIHTMDWYRPNADRELGVLPGVLVNGLVDAEIYKRCLCEADALVIAYNFDPKSIGYIGLSLANKMPECLASGAPLLAYGPIQVATIDYLKKAGCAQVVDSRNDALLRSAIQALITQPDYCRQLGEKARVFVSRNLTMQMVQNTFHRLMVRASTAAPLESPVLIGPFDRGMSAHYDETECVAELYSAAFTGSMMIDVGAHHGWALAPFLAREWTIYAFEPDEKNRAKLVDRLAKHKNKALVSLDTRCVTNKSQKGVSFYRSEESTGISGLSAFHETDVEAQRVDTVTLTEFFEDKSLPVVDFLKIDTEGHDLFVLQGFPWDRTKPAVIECEFADTKTVPLGYTFHDLARFLVDKGYTVYVSEWHPIIRYGIRHDWNRLVRYPSELANGQGWGNLLAFRDPIDEKDLVAAVRKVLKVGAGEPAAAAATPVKASVTAASFGAGFGGRAYNVVPGTHFIEISVNQWRYTHSDATQRLWQAVFNVAGSTAGRSFVVGICLKSNRAMTVTVSVGRVGSSEYEGASQRITLAPGVAQSVQVRKAFTKPHAALKAQVEVLQLDGGGTADLTIDSVSVNETLGSIRHRMAENDLNIRVSNRLFRDGDYSTAMGLYLMLHQQRPLKMYSDNALMAARKLGMDEMKSVDQLLQWLG